MGVVYNNMCIINDELHMEEQDNIRLCDKIKYQHNLIQQKDEVINSQDESIYNIYKVYKLCYSAQTRPYREPSDGGN